MSESRLRVAVIGSGISGVATAWFLHRDHEVTVFEASSRLGGHTRTVDVATGHGDTVAVDTGFIVFNDRTYPNFTKLLGQLGVPWRDSEMSFSVRDGAGNREWNGRDLRRVFGQRRNLLRPSHWRMVRDILRWNRLALALVESGDGVTETLGEFMVRHRFSAVFKAQYLVPMAAAIWSAPPNVLLDYPAGFIARFFREPRHAFTSRPPHLADCGRWVAELLGRL